MLNHLFLKAIHRAGDADRYQEASMGFHHAYETAVAPGLRTDMRALMRQTGALMLARVDGKSPAEYLDETGRGRAWQVGTSLLLEPPGSLPEAWLRVRREQAP
jgi:5-methylthioribose kinase